jgi:long-chain acyl-CoA synthetase
MNGVLARIVGDAFKSLDHAVESTGGDRQGGASLAALAGRVVGALVARGVAPDEPVHMRIGNRPSDLGTLLGIWQAGAVAVPVHVSAVPSTLERLQGVTRARFSADGDRIDPLAAWHRRRARSCATPPSSSSRRAAPESPRASSSGTGACRQAGGS